MRAFSALLLCCAVGAAHAGDHDELDATLLAPYRGNAGGDARIFRVVLEHPQLPAPRLVDWRVELAVSDGRVLRTWRGRQQLADGAVAIELAWDGRIDGAPAAAGRYRATLFAGDIEQGWEIAAGALPPVALAAPAAALRSSSAPAWQVVLGNLHSQTGHSDGGGSLARCHGAQEPQSSLLGPTAAFSYADSHGLDFLVASEHNHMYDGSAGTNANADPLAARGLYRAGREAADAYHRAHPRFLAIYATEWGVIEQGGHLNIFNAPSLLGWEKNGAGQLLADIETPKNDYAALYALMRKEGWIGQFNHPARSGQFLVDGKPLGYSADGDAVMVLCEVVNTNAFSSNASESESRRSIYEGACNQALEAGYHLAFSTDQDNHCANWGMSYTNRTGVLIAAGQPPGPAALFDALRARRVFATMDRRAQLLLTANGHLMGERFANRGPLRLLVDYSSSAGQRIASIAVVEGVPGRNGSVSTLSASLDTTITPATGEHFYYARLTQDDGNMLWSAPVWVSQLAP